MKKFCGEFEVMNLVEDEMEQFANMAPREGWIWLTSIIIIYNSITFVLVDSQNLRLICSIYDFSTT